jgi:hypothetical protein
MLFDAMPTKRTSLKWLHLENVLAGIFEARYEIYLCLTDENHCSVYLCSDSPLIMKHLRRRTLLIPACKALIVNALSERKREIVSFKYSDCGRGKMSGKVCMFRTLKQFIERKSTQVNGDVKIRMLSYFSSLEFHFENYFFLYVWKVMIRLRIISLLS